jgi:hypothetical protein
MDDNIIKHYKNKGDKTIIIIENVKEEDENKEERVKRGYELTLKQLGMLQELKYKWYPNKHFQEIVGAAIEDYYYKHEMK